MLARFQPPVDETLEPVLTPGTDSEIQPESDTSEGEKYFFMNINFCENAYGRNSCPIHSPDLNYDGEWEKLLLVSPFLENPEDNQLDRKDRLGLKWK